MKSVLCLLAGFVLLAVVSVLPATATDYTSTNFILRDPVVSVGGGYASSSSFQYFSSTGEAVVGESSGTTFTERAGFLFFSTTPVVSVVAPVASGGGGGGNISVPAPSVIFSGRAYPLSKVNILKDGQLAVGTIAGPDAQFNVELAGLSSGNYLFSVSGEDKGGRRGTLFTFPVAITQGATTTISGIFLSPTIEVDKAVVMRGDNISIFGTSIPAGEVTIAVNSHEEQFVKTKSDKDGVYLYDFDTSALEVGDHLTKSKVALANQISTFSPAIGFQVGGATTIKAEGAAEKVDFNSDGKINIADFSILAFWYKKPLSSAFRAIESTKLNGDGKITLVDFSILAFYWTG